MRKTAIPLLLLIALFTFSVQAQQTTVVVQNAGEEDDLHLKIGVLAGLTLAMNTTDYQVSSVSRFLDLGSHFGVRASVPLGRKTRFVGGVGLHTLSFKDENKRISFNDDIDNHSTNIDANGVLTTNGTFQYTVITAMFQFSQFFIGMNFGLPMSSEMKNELSTGPIREQGINPVTDWLDSPPNVRNMGRVIKADISPETEDVNMLLELRAGGEFALVKSPMGDLNLGISLGWTFNKILKPTKDLDDDTPSKYFLPNFDDQFYLPNVLFHLSWMFNI
jgi:hypothetical protein